MKKMITSALTAVAVYVATGIDYLIILILLFSQIKKGQAKHIWIGQYIGTAIIIAASLLVALGITWLIPQQWVLGLLGLIPLYLGIRFGSRERRMKMKAIYYLYFPQIGLINCI